MNRDTETSALCRNDDPDKWFPETAPPHSRKHTRKRVPEAVLICQRCPIRRECLQFALEHGYSHGIWGGLTEGERRKLNHPRLPRERASTKPKKPKKKPRKVTTPSSDVNGVAWSNSRLRWQVVIRRGANQKNWIGTYPDKATAEAAALAAHERFGTSPRRQNTRAA